MYLSEKRMKRYCFQMDCLLARSCVFNLMFLDNPQLLRLIRYLVEVGEILFHKKSLTFL